MSVRKFVEKLAMEERLEIADAEMRSEYSQSTYYFIRKALVDMGVLIPRDGKHRGAKIWVINWLRAKQAFPDLDVPPSLLARFVNTAKKPVSGEAHA